jgi:hypothetical protein
MKLGFNGKGLPTQPKERRVGQSPKAKIDGWQAAVP